jgi:protein-S-isoprenylcysteine O-methyltransferase Ste14
VQTLYLIAYILILSAGILILRFIIRRAYRAHDRLPFIPAMLQVLLFFFYGGFPALYLPADWPAVHVNLFQHMFGLFLLFGGLVILCYGMVLLGLLRSVGGDKPALEQAGLYRFTRNPQALACGSYVLGFALLWPSGYGIGWAILYVTLIHAMVLTEEEHLQHIHGPRYEAYCQQVPRYFRWGSTNENASS